MGAQAADIAWQVLLLIPHPTARMLLTEAENRSRRPQLPSFRAHGEEPSMQDLVAGMTRALGRRTPTPLRVSWPLADETNDGGVILVETEPLRDQPSAQFGWAGFSRGFDYPGPAGVEIAIRSWIDEQLGRLSTLRPPWSRVGWLALASEWMVTQLNAVGATVTRRPAFHQMWDFSVVLRATTTDGDAYFKCSAHTFRHEAALTQALAAATPELLPHVIAIDKQQGWLLMADLSGRPLGDEPPSRWPAALTGHAHIQQTWQNRSAELMEIGAQPRPLNELAARIETVHDDDALMARLEPSIRKDWIAQAPALVERCLRLEQIGPDPTLVHGDLHPWNVMIGPTGLKIFDWTDAALSHPFVDLATYLSRTENLSARLAAWDQYLAAWADLLTPAELQEAGTLALVVGMLYQLETYRRLLPTAMPGNPLQGAEVSCLVRSLRWHHSGLDGIPSTN